VPSGGAIAQQLAWLHAERVRRVVLINTRTGATMVPGAPSALLSMLTPHHFTDPDYMANIAPDLCGCGSEQTRALLSGLHHILKPRSTLG
jgi:pimeloyl-ACP methyl ester carboxylesterase